MQNYIGGSIKKSYNHWKFITSDKFILDIIQYGLKLEFSDEKPIKHSIHTSKFNKIEEAAIEAEIDKLLHKKVIVPTDPYGGFTSGVFTRPKKDGSLRFILNLKNLNKFVGYKHFKMESIYNVFDLITPGAYMASVDLKDAFFSIPIFNNHQQYLKFCFNNITYKFTCMPNGYGPAMRVFTKVLKAPFAYLREKNHVSVVYVDDTWLLGSTYEECLDNVMDTIDLLRALGFTIHIEKSMIVPKQEITFLGFIFNSISMTVTLTKDKKQKIFELCKNRLNNNILFIRDLASIIGNIVASFPGVPYGK